jgi:hypothetical protein
MDFVGYVPFDCAGPTVDSGINEFEYPVTPPQSQHKEEWLAFPPKPDNDDDNYAPFQMKQESSPPLVDAWSYDRKQSSVAAFDNTTQSPFAQLSHHDIFGADSKYLTPDSRIDDPFEWSESESLSQTTPTPAPKRKFEFLSDDNDSSPAQPAQHMSLEELAVFLQSTVTPDNIKALQILGKHIRGALDTTMKNKVLLQLKVDTLKHDLAKNATGGGFNLRGHTRDRSIEEASKKTAMVPGILQRPRIDPYKTDKEHRQSIIKYQVNLEIRQKIKGFEGLVQLAEENYNILMDRLISVNEMEPAINDYLEQRADAEKCELLQGLEELIVETEEELTDIRACFSLLETLEL